MNGEPKPALARHLWWALPLLAGLWFKELDFPRPAAETGLDDSWHAVKGWELLHHPRLGVESVFTYGPLGWFHSACHVPELFWWKILFWECGVKLVLCAMCVLAVVRARGWFQRLFFAVALALSGSGPDAFAYISLAAILGWVLAEEQRSARSELPVLFVAALLSAVKFTYFSTYGVGIVLACAGLWHASGRARALQFLGRAAGMLALAWLAIGQSPLDLLQYVRTSWWIASGYNDGMARVGPAEETALAAWILVAGVGIVAIQLGRGPRTSRHVLLGLFLLLCGWASFKSGFTRHMGNATLFFSSAPVLTWFLLPGPARAGLLDLALVCVQRTAQAWMLVAGAYGFLHSLDGENLPLSHYLLFQRVELEPKFAQLTHLGELRAELDRGLELARERFRLPRIAERVGGESVDVFGAAQNVALLNGFDYRPRPVFQSYSAYTPELVALNRDFYAGPCPPRFVLYHQDGIDLRLAIHDDAPAFEMLLRRYQPQFSERGYLLLERVDPPRAPGASEVVLEQDLELGKWIELDKLPGKVLQLELAIERSLRGDLRAFTLGGPALLATLEHPNGSQTTARILPRSASEGFLVRPELESQDEAVLFFCGEELPGLKRISFFVPKGESALWNLPLHVRVLRRDGLQPAPRRELLAATRYSMFDPPPEKVVCAHPFGPVELPDRIVGLCHAPSTLLWNLDAGHFALATSFGLLDSAWSGTNCTDGAVFQVLLVPDGGKPQTLFERRLDPAQTPGDRGLQATQLEFDAEVHSRLALRIGAGPAGNSACDWTYWSDFKLRSR